MKFEVVRYNWQMIDGQPKIVISMIKQMDDDGRYVKFAKLADVVHDLAYHPVMFRELETEKELNFGGND